MNPMAEAKMTVVIMELEKQIERAEKTLKLVKGKSRETILEFYNDLEGLLSNYRILTEKHGRIKKTKAFMGLTWRINKFKKKWKDQDQKLEEILGRYDNG